MCELVSWRKVLWGHTSYHFNLDARKYLIFLFRSFFWKCLTMTNGFNMIVAPSHYARCVSDHLDRTFRNNWIGCGDPAACDPLQITWFIFYWLFSLGCHTEHGVSPNIDRFGENWHDVIFTKFIDISLNVSKLGENFMLVSIFHWINPYCDLSIYIFQHIIWLVKWYEVLILPKCQQFGYCMKPSAIVII